MVATLSNEPVLLREIEQMVERRRAAAEGAPLSQDQQRDRDAALLLIGAGLTILEKLRPAAVH